MTLLSLQMINSEEPSDAITGHGEVSAEDKVAFPLLFGKQDLDGDLMSSPPERYRYYAVPV